MVKKNARPPHTTTDITKRYHFDTYCLSSATISTKSFVFLLAMDVNYLTVNAITSDAITEAALTIVDTTDSLYALFWLYLEFA